MTAKRALQLLAARMLGAGIGITAGLVFMRVASGGVL